MSDMNYVILPDLGKGAANGAAEEHGTPVQGSDSSKGLSS